MNKKYFGTDGIRGRVGEAPITAEFMLKLGWAAGRVFAAQGYSYILIGKDTRISGYMFESALEAGIISAGVNVGMLGPMPTPAIAYLTRTFHAQAGIVISASHNPYHDNGIKFFSGEGRKLPDALEYAIEAELEKPPHTVESRSLGKASRIIDAAGRYIEFCKSTAPAGTLLEGLKIVVDCANGATYHVAPSVFSELGATVEVVGGKPDGLNINENCGSTKPEMLREKVLSLGFDLGIAFDGDGDRVLMVDHRGEILDGDELVYIIARQLHQSDALHGGVAGTLMSNLGLELALQQLGIPFERAKVGDRYVMETLARCGWILGGESSGHIIYLDKSTTGDGVVAALQVLGAMVNGGKSLHELKQGMSKMPQTMVNVLMARRCDPIQNALVQKAVASIQQKLGDQGRVLLRLSGTEPLVRVMVEGTDEMLVSQLANELAGSVKQAMS